MKKKSAMTICLLSVLIGTGLYGKEDECEVETRKAAEALVATPDEKTANNDDLELGALLDVFFHSGADAATREYRMRCNLHYLGLLMKEACFERLLRENDSEERRLILHCFDRKSASEPLPDWKNSGAKQPSMETLLDLFFKGGETNITCTFRSGCHDGWTDMESKAKSLDILLALPDDSAREKMFDRMKKWLDLDKKRNERDFVILEGGSGSSMFKTFLEIERREKFLEYLGNMALMDEIETFPVRCLEKEIIMQNGEIDFDFPKSSYEAAHAEPVAIIAPATVKKQVINGDVWHVAVFLPDDLIPHEMKHGGCLVVWKNRQHVSSYTWEEDIRISELEFSKEKKVRISGRKIIDYDKDGDATNMEFDIAEPNGKELDVNYGLKEILDIYSKYADEDDDSDDDELEYLFDLDKIGMNSNFLKDDTLDKIDWDKIDWEKIDWDKIDWENFDLETIDWDKLKRDESGNGE